jgi:hypothetical protein
MTPRIRRQGRSAPIVPLATVALLTAVAFAASGTASMAMTDATPSQHCHEFVRFGERWEHCFGPNGLEAHRLGVFTPGRSNSH